MAQIKLESTEYFLNFANEILTLLHFPPPCLFFHHFSFIMCNCPPSCNCRIALLIGVLNGESINEIYGVQQLVHS